MDQGREGDFSNFGKFFFSGFKMIIGYLGFKHEVKIEVEQACQKWNDKRRREIVGRSKEMQIKDRTER